MIVVNEGALLLVRRRVVGEEPPDMPEAVAALVTPAQWSSVVALKALPPYAKIEDSMAVNTVGWQVSLVANPPHQGSPVQTLQVHDVS